VRVAVAVLAVPVIAVGVFYSVRGDDPSKQPECSGQVAAERPAGCFR
jgi:hypothetical protein